MKNAIHEEQVTAIFAKYRDFVYATARRMTGSPYHAEEILQEAFIRVWSHREKLAEIKDMESWLFIITKRLVSDYIVKLSTQRNFLAKYRRPDCVAHIGDVNLSRDCMRILAEAQQGLTRREKEIYQLRHVQGIQHAEIAQALNIAEATVIYFSKTSMRAVKAYVTGKLEEDRRIA